MPERVLRFSPAERAVHRATGLLFLVCLLTALALYVAPVAQLVGRRLLVETVHEWSGLLLPVPALLGLWSGPFRADVRRFDRFTGHDRRWLASLRHEPEREREPQQQPGAEHDQDGAREPGRPELLAGVELPREPAAVRVR